MTVTRPCDVEPLQSECVGDGAFFHADLWEPPATLVREWAVGVLSAISHGRGAALSDILPAVNGGVPLLFKDRDGIPRSVAGDSTETATDSALSTSRNCTEGDSISQSLFIVSAPLWTDSQLTSSH